MTNPPAIVTPPAEALVAGAVTNAEIERVEAKLLDYPQVDCPLEHFFSPGVYVRQVTMPAGSLIIGHEHKTRHLNMVLSGRALVMVNGMALRVEAPFTFESEPGVRKVLLILEEMKWATIHVTTETDLAKLEEALIVKSQSYLHYQADIARLREIAADLHE